VRVEVALAQGTKEMAIIPQIQISNNLVEGAVRFLITYQIGILNKWIMTWHNRASGEAND